MEGGHTMLKGYNVEDQAGGSSFPQIVQWQGISTAFCTYGLFLKSATVRKEILT